MAEQPRRPVVALRIPEVREIERMPGERRSGLFQVGEPDQPQHREIRREDADHAPGIEGTQRRAGFVFGGVARLQQKPGDQEAGKHEEQPDPEMAEEGRAVRRKEMRVKHQRHLPSVAAVLRRYRQ